MFKLANNVELTISLEHREWLRAALLDILRSSPSREGRWLLDSGLGNGNGLGAVHELVDILARDGELRHRLQEVVIQFRNSLDSKRKKLIAHTLEAAHHEGLVVDHILPSARRLRVVRDREVGLETQLALCCERIGHLSGGLTRRRREGLGALEQDLKEDLRIEREGRRVEGHRGAIGDERVRARDGVRDEQGNELGGAETRILHAREDLVDVVLRLGDEAERGGVRRVRATREELESGRTRAVRDTNGAGKLDQVPSRDGEFLEQWAQKINGVIDTVVSG